jgi:hypothetical protein
MNTNTEQWGEISVQELKGVPYYGTPKWSSLSCSTPTLQDIDIGSDWDYSVPEDISYILISNWCEQDSEQLVYWLPVLVYRMLVDSVSPINLDTDPFSRAFLLGLSGITDQCNKVFGSGYCKLLNRACRVAGLRWQNVDGARDVSTCLGSLGILLG